MAWSVYRHVFPNNKTYVGITSQNPERRWLAGHGYRGQETLWNAIKKYGWASIRHEIVATGLTQEEALDLEVILIARFDSASREHGYNRTPGGDASCLGYKQTKEHIENHAKTIRGKPQTTSHKSALRLAQGHRKQIRCIETGKEYDSIKQAVSEIGGSPGNLSMHLKGRYKKFMGFTFVQVNINSPVS